MAAYIALFFIPNSLLNLFSPLYEMALQITPIEPTGIYASKVKSSAEALGLDLEVYPYSQILESMEKGANVFEVCARITGTGIDEQLKFVLASNGSLNDYPYIQAAVCVVPSSGRVDFNKIPVLLEQELYKSIKDYKFSSNRAKPEIVGIEPGYLGFYDNLRFPKFEEYGDIFPIFDKSHSEEKIPYLIDSSVKDLMAICAPLGKGKTNDLGVISGKENIGFYLDTFLESIIGKGSFAFGNVCKEKDRSQLSVSQSILCRY
ncbi:Uncharacterised protein [uncultured archaeon]|nr:Uncharacterised protein [uncultured archaeon]